MVRPLLTLLAMALAVLAPGYAHASGGVSQDTLQPVLILLGVVTFAYLVAHGASEWLQRRFGFVTGVEYMVVGAVLGPGVGLLSEDMTSKFVPAIVLGTGSLGLLTGLQLNLRRMTAHRTGAVLPAFWVSVLTLLVVGIVPMALLTYFAGNEALSRFLPHVLAIAAVALVADQSMIRSLVGYLHARGDGVNFLLRVARVCSAIAVVVFGVLFCLNKPVIYLPIEVNLWGAGALWFGAHLILGGVLGVIFAAFLLRDYEDDKLLAVTMGMVIFTSGLAYYLQLSPVFVNFVLGFVLSNINRQSDRVEQMLLSVERPLYIVLFFFAGADLRFDIPWWAYGGFLILLLLRLVGRTAGGFIVGRLTPGTRSFPMMGTALLAPGGLSVAMALDYFEVYDETEWGAIVYVTLVLAIISSEIISYRATRRWLIDATDVATEYANKKGAE
ncbi:MAG: cation:proton antiporter [bacterium]